MTQRVPLHVQVIIDRAGDVLVLSAESPARLLGELHSYITDIWPEVHEGDPLPGSYSRGGALLELDSALAMDALEECGFKFHEPTTTAVDPRLLLAGAPPAAPAPSLRTYSVVYGVSVEAYWETTFKAADSADAIAQARKYCPPPEDGAFEPSWDTAHDLRIVELLDRKADEYILEDDRNFSGEE